jgi:UDP-N-acetylglucosamine 4,6-dehydratase
LAGNLNSIIQVRYQGLLGQRCRQELYRHLASSVEANSVVDLSTAFTDKRILVVGGTGSIGSGLTRALLRMKPGVVRVLSNDENGLFEMQRELGDRPDLRFLMGDVRDKGRLELALRDIDIVFHAAALKHVPISEYNPFDVVQTNVVGTQNLLEAAILRGVEKFVFISTDKAVNPASTLGASKLLCEKLVLDAASYRGPKLTAISCVRFGNVLATRGSVMNVFLSQIAKGGPLTVTDKSMTRFVMLQEEATSLLLKAAEISRGGEIFVLKMDGLRIIDLARAMIEEFAPAHGFKPEAIKLQEIGVRPGEKMHEELMTEDEASRSFESEDLYVILPVYDAAKGYKDFTPAKLTRYTSKDVKLLRPEALRELCRKAIISRIL